MLGLDGQARLQVRIVPDSKTGESTSAQGNNTLAGSSLVSINKLLTLELSPNRVDENAGRRITLRVNRSGRWTAAETFAITATADSRVSVPTSITIPANQSGAVVYFNVTDNDVLDEDSIVNISAEGNGYAAVSSLLLIDDNEQPDLMLKASKNDITEGETFQLTITRSATLAQPVSVTLNSENAKRFSFPAAVTIPAGESSVTIDVTAVDDELPSLELSNVFTASAPRYNKGEVIVLLNDNDMPVLTLELTPNQVQESVGVVAVAGVLRRTTNTNSKITVRLSDDSDGGLYFGNTQLVLDKGVEEVHFNFGPVDNAQMDGDRTYTITAAVWLSSCNCGAAGEKAGAVTAQLTVLDDDGPTLQLTTSAATVKEGDKTTLTVSRNNADDTPLTVTLTSDYDDNLTYNHTVTIPAGQTTATVEVTSLANDVQSDSHTVVFTAKADGYSSGTCYILVTDQTLTDARISSITADVQEAEVGTKATLTIEVTNDGAAVLPAEVSVKLYLRGGSAVGTVYTSEAIAVGGSLTVTKTITLPTTVGRNSFYAVVNEGNAIQELTYNNNTSEDVVVNIVAPYTVTVSTDKTIYKQGEKIQITGKLTGKNTANAEVDLYIINEGLRQVQKVITDAQGAFYYEWELFALQSGHFAVGACYPGEGLKTKMAAFDVYGLRRTEYSNIICDVTQGDTYTGYIDFVNPGLLDLTGCNVELLSVPATCEAQFSIPSTISGGQTAQLSYAIKGIAATPDNNWEKIEARVTTNEEVSLDFFIYFYCRNAQGKLMASSNNIVTTMTKGKERDYSIQVTNIGRGNTGKITLALPEFIKSLVGNSLPALEQNDTLTIPLLLIPTEGMQLNVPVTGQMGINCENGDGVPISFSITPVSDENGTLVVDVCDEYTYYTSEAPHVANAVVIVRNPVTNALVTQGRTDSNGLFTMVMPEGYYILNVTADNHDSYTNNVYVDPGMETREVINLSTQAITVSWKVEETEIEDEYEIVTTVQYETNVPEPVVVVDVPQSIPADELTIGESLIFNAVATNKGLIAAQGFTLEMPEDIEHLLFEPLTEYQDLTLAPSQSVTIPIRVTRIPVEGETRSNARRKISVMNILRCIASILPRYYWDCGPDRKWHRYKTSFNIGKCKTSDPDITITVISTPPPIVIGDPILNGGGGYSYGGTWSCDTIRTVKYEGCEPCQNRTLLTMIDCGLSLVARYKQLKGVINCAISAIEAMEVVTDKDKKARHKLAALLGTVVTCKNAIITGKGDKNKTHQQQREEAIEKLIDLLADITSKIGQEDFDGLKDWENIVDMVGSAASIVIDLAGFDYDDVEELLCPLKLLKPCDYDDDDLYDENDKHGTAKVKRRSNVQYPSYLNGYRNAVSYGALDMIAMTSIRKEFFGDISWLDCSGEQLDYFMQAFLLSQNEDGVIEESMYGELEVALPEDMSVSDMRKLVERWNNTVLDVVSENKIDIERSLGFSHVIKTVEERIHADGYADIDECISAEHEKALSKLNESNSSVCATISLQFSQKMVLTRQAFRGTLTVYNGHESIPMTNVKLFLKVTSEDGLVATSSEMEMHGETLSVFDGDAHNLLGGWTLGAQQTGYATVMFIPTPNAAPTEPKNYFFGGTLSYIDPFTGLEVSRELTPVMLTVNPTPILDLTYFMQRDIYGDDPLTEEVEPTVPAEFALVINNKGNGDANNVRMVTQQPEIIENEKGLLINFNLISSQVNGGDAALSFGQSIANDFGTIPAHSQMYAQWWLQSSLLGHFTDYKVEATHVTSYGNEDLSLLDEVTIHELIHGFTVRSDGDMPVRGFLVNDIVDADDLPDEVYFTDATQQAAYIATNADISIKKQSDTEYVLNVNASNPGWNYGSLLDPTYGKQKLVKVTRADGTEVNVDNIWQTDRTLRDGKDWLYENRLHFVGNMSAEGETFYLTFEPKPELELEVESYAGVPVEGTVLKEQLTGLTVKFNKPIKAESFTTDDITINCQGVQQDASQIVIEQVNETEYKLTLNEVTLLDGYYVLTVQTAGIEDNEGFTGSTGKQASWIQFVDGKVTLKATASPAEGGTVTPASGRFDYDSNVTLKATAAEGYDFTGWTLGGEVLSTESELSYHLIADAELKALFTIKHYNVTIDYDPTQGLVEGAATGIYDYGTQLQLTAVPADGYDFDVWMIGDEREDSTSSYMLFVNRDMDVNALFKEKISTDIQNLDEETLHVSITPLPLSNYMYIKGNFNKIRYVSVYDMSGIKVLSENNVQSDQSIYVGNLKVGIYYIQIATDRGIYRAKVLKR